MFFHIWFVTKYRKPVLEGKIQKFVEDIFAEIIERHSYKILQQAVSKDHVHMLVEAKDKADLAGIVRALKTVSAKEILGTPHFRVGNSQHFLARRYGSREIEPEQMEQIRDYIRNQKNTTRANVWARREKNSTHGSV